jgi:hypothetical protein
MRHDRATDDGPVLRRLRTLLLVILVIGLAGTAADLLLLEHYEDVWQIPPLAVVALGLVVGCWAWHAGSARAVTAMRVTMVLFLATGAAGLYLHYAGNAEFQQEMEPSLGGWALFVAVMRAKAPPALAPAAFIQLGLIGLLYTFRHAALEQLPSGTPPTSEERSR